MSDIFDEDVARAASGTLTGADLRRAADILRARPRLICEHVVHPKAEGWTNCANCFAPVRVTKPALDTDSVKEEE